MRASSREQGRRVRHARLRRKVSGSAERPRLLVRRTLHHIYATVVDDTQGRTLVAAFAELRQTYPSLRLVLAGKRDVLFRRLERQTQIKGIKNVIFTGFVSDGQLRWLYEHTKAYIFPSLSEGFGLPGLEAMMHGAPVVSSNATCLPEVYKDAVIYFDPLDIEDMAARIHDILTDEKLRKQLIAKGTALANSYSWLRLAEQTLAVYQEVLKTSS